MSKFGDVVMKSVFVKRLFSVILAITFLTFSGVNLPINDEFVTGKKPHCSVIIIQLKAGCHTEVKKQNSVAPFIQEKQSASKLRRELTIEYKCVEK